MTDLTTNDQAGWTDSTTVIGNSAAAQQDVAAPSDRDAIQRTYDTLDRLDQLADLLDGQQYELPPPEYEVPTDLKVSIVIPVYNEQATIHQILARVGALPVKKEIIIVDDYSTDQTRDLLKPLQEIPELSIIYKSRNEGKGAALRTGFEYVTGDIVVIQDADLEYDPRDIMPLLRPILDNDADIVYGSRFFGDKIRDPSLIHRLGNGLLTSASNMFTGLELTDMETCYKALRSDALRSFEIKQNRFGFEPEVTAKLARRGFRFVEVPISYNARGYEEGKKIGVKDLINAMYCILRYGLSD